MLKRQECVGNNEISIRYERRNEEKEWVLIQMIEWIKWIYQWNSINELSRIIYQFESCQGY